MRSSAFIALLFCFSITAFSQKKDRLKFTSINQVGFLKTSKLNSLNVETINGVQYKTWSVGIGAGIDWQLARSVPLFLDVRKYFKGKKNNWFLYGDAGENIGWEKNENLYLINPPYLNTFFSEGGIGYSFLLNQKTALFFSAGYGFKKTEYKTEYTLISDFYPYSSSRTQVYTFDTYINRLVIKAGIQF